VFPAIDSRFGRRAAEGVARPLWSLVQRLLAPFDATFVAGAAQADSLRRAGSRNVIHVPFGVDIGTFHPGQRSAVRRSDLLGDLRGPLVVAVGRLAFEKHWDVVLDAFRILRGREPGACLVMLGDGPERARLEQEAPPGVRFLGFERDRSRLASALASADMLVHACPYETFGLAVAEAIACGIPVVVPDRGGAAHAADPESGIRYASLNVRACAEAMAWVLARHENDGRLRALAAAARVHTAEAHVKAVVSAYDDMLRARGP
jgi:alpha-1,6-mannosyltransferase